MTAPISEDRLVRVSEALYRGKKIEAVKRYREETHSSLAEAKRAVEQWEVQLRNAAPERFVVGYNSRKTALFHLTVWSIMAVGWAIICVSSAVRQAKGEERASFWTWMGWFVLASAIYTAYAAFRKLRKLQKP